MPTASGRQIDGYLLDAGLVTEDQFRLAVAEGRRTGERVGDALVRLGLVSSEDLTACLARQARIDVVDLDAYPVDDALLLTVSESFLRRHRMLPIARQGTTLIAATSTLDHLGAVDELQRLTGLFVRVVAAPDGQIQARLDRAMSAPHAVAAPVPLATAPAGGPPAAPLDATEQDAAGVIHLVEDLFRTAAREGATDLHIEPLEGSVATRYRYDGLLQPGPTLSRALYGAIVTRVKILAELNISETRMPQDGRITFEDRGKRFDFRVSTFPSLHGENIAVRVLDLGRAVRVDMLGLTPDRRATLRRYIERPHGLIVVTGPTGSGKTTTLYAALLELNAADKNIMTLEDPVEYELAAIRQSQINPRAGFTFAAGLRAILRHDPNVILVGEIRDLETAETTIRAAMTGHLVFSTLHTNDAVGAIPRLIDMGIPAYLLASSLRMVLGQRLIRMICASCRVAITPDEAGLARLGPAGAMVQAVFAGSGCASCRGTGYRGRTGVFELFEVTPAITELMTQGADGERLKAQARKDGMETLVEDAVGKLSAGTTTVDEVVRVVYGAA